VFKFLELVTNNNGQIGVRRNPGMTNCIQKLLFAAESQGVTTQQIPG
jgi:hypothetical protein